MTLGTIQLTQLSQKSDQTELIEFEEFLPNLDTLTPVRGRLRVVHQGNYLEVTVKAETIVTLACDRCLQNYNHRLVVKTTELIWLQEDQYQFQTEPVEVEVPFEELVESLSPLGVFDAEAWLYEQFCLAFPHRKLCDPDCAGIPLDDTDTSKPIIDARWASLSKLKLSD